MKSGQLRWGILGCGLISGDFVEALKLLNPEEHKVTALGSRSLERCKEFRSKHNLPDAAVYGSYEEFIKDPNIDIVYIGTRNNQHHDDTLLALKSKRHVLCEKPLGVSKHEVEEMIAAAKEAGVYFQEAFWSRFFPVYKEIRKVLSDGRIGDVQIVQANFGERILDKFERIYSRDLGGGLALDLCCYLVQFVLLVFGKETPIESVTTVGWQRRGVDDSASCTIKFKGNKLAQLLYSGSVEIRNGAQICGTKGRIEIPKDIWCPENFTVTIFNDKGEPTTEEFEYKRPACDPKKFYFEGSEGLSYEADGVRKNIMKGDKESSEITLEESLIVAETLESIRRQLGVL